MAYNIAARAADELSPGAAEQPLATGAQAALRNQPAAQLPRRRVQLPKIASFDQKAAGVRRPKTYIREEAAKECDLEDAGLKDVTGLSPDKGMDGGLEWAKRTCRRGLRPLLKEFANVRKYLPSELATDCFNQNPAKNRYTDVMCLDKTRVVLQGRAKDNDYIHASWVTLQSNRRYICTQGPLEETIDDFWWMIFKEEVQAIVMLCDFIEDGDVKCAEYYPITVGEKVQYGDIIVKNEKHEEPMQSITCQLLILQFEDEKHQVHHCKWLGWPDRSAPLTCTPLLALITKLKPLQEKGPIAVHCSAGIGRTGTYCAVDYAIDRLGEEGTISPPEIIKEIRRQRLHSVQSVLQYVYMHMCIIDYLMINKSLPRDLMVRRFQRDYERYLKKYNDRLAKEKLAAANEQAV